MIFTACPCHSARPPAHPPRKFRPEKTGFNRFAEYTQLQLIVLALEPWC